MAFNNTSVLIAASQVADPRALTGLTTALAQQGQSVAGYDFVVAVNIDPTRSEGGFSTPGSMPAFIYMGNFSNWKNPLTPSDFSAVAGAVYHHEVVHHWGWPGTHDWTTCGPALGFNFQVPPVLLGWEDTDGVPEILDATPYGRSRP